jgi:hypothetical protein
VVRYTTFVVIEIVDGCNECNDVVTLVVITPVGIA